MEKQNETRESMYIYNIIHGFRIGLIMIFFSLMIFAGFDAFAAGEYNSGSGTMQQYLEYIRNSITRTGSGTYNGNDTLFSANNPCTLAVFDVSGRTSGGYYADSTYDGQHLIGTNIYNIAMKVTEIGDGDASYIDSAVVILKNNDGSFTINWINGINTFIDDNAASSIWYPTYRSPTLTASSTYTDFILQIPRWDVTAYLLIWIGDSAKVDYNIWMGRSG